MKRRILKLIRESGSDKLADPVLYKYHPDNQYLTSLLKNNTIYFGNPINFNDPFDCNLVVNNTITENEIKGYFQSNKWKKKIDEDELIKKIYLSDYKDKDAFKERFSHEYKEALASIGVTCFTQEKSNLLLWAHYTNNHKGVCLEFDSSKDPEFFKLLKKVEYREKYPVFEYLKYKKAVLSQLLLIKSIEWKYEHEIRIIKTRHRKFEFKPAALTGVYFGMRASGDFIRKTKKLIDSTGNYAESVKYYSTKLAVGYYKLEFEEIPSSFFES